MAVAAPSVAGPEFAEKVRRADEITRRLQESNWDFDAVPELFTRAATCDVVAKEIVTIHDGRAQTLLGRLVMNGIGEEFQLNSPSSALNITLPGRPEVFKEINDQLGSQSSNEHAVQAESALARQQASICSGFHWKAVPHTGRGVDSEAPVRRYSARHPAP